jgi:hypothetical protein
MILGDVTVHSSNVIETVGDSPSVFVRASSLRANDGISRGDTHGVGFWGVDGSSGEAEDLMDEIGSAPRIRQSDRGSFLFFWCLVIPSRIRKMGIYTWQEGDSAASRFLF